MSRVLLVAQLAGTLAILGSPIANTEKLAAFLLWWALTFRRVRREELALYALGCAVFTALDALSVGRGVFRFAHPDLLGLPRYELALWGFYLVHATRALGMRAAARPGWPVWALLVAFAPAFAVSADPRLVLGWSGAVLAVALARFHDRGDLAFVGYLVVLGTAVELVGVRSGEWSYPSGGVPAWSVTMWGGVGFFLHRLVLPLLGRANASFAAPANEPFPAPRGPAKRLGSAAGTPLALRSSS